jgi:type IV pilus assembly protein PilC
MPKYFYTAKTIDGKTVKGDSIAENTHELSQSLKDQELILVRAVMQGSKIKTLFNFSFVNKVPVTEKILMTRNLAVMVATGLSLVNSFEVLSLQARNKKLKDALVNIKEKINKGESMSDALSSYADVFSQFFLSMIKVGEESGTLEDVLKILSQHLEREHRLKSEIQGAMIYPAIVMSLMLVVGGVVAVVVLPRLSAFFTGVNAKIPFYTKILIAIGEFSVKNWPFLLAMPIILVFLGWMGLKTKKGKWLADTILLKIPLISSLVKKSNCATFIRSLSSLLSAGVPLTKSLDVIYGTLGNFYFRKAISESLEKIKKGEKLSKTLIPYKDIFPVGAIEMIEVGEETGKTSTVLKTLADFYEEELIRTTGKLSTMIEPVLLIFLGLAVGFFAFSIIEPMYSSLQSIR